MCLRIFPITIAALLACSAASFAGEAIDATGMTDANAEVEETELRATDSQCDSPGEQVGEALFHGFVFLEGKYFHPPYVLSWNGTAVMLNGVPVPVKLYSDKPRDWIRVISRVERRLRDDAMMVSVAGEPVVFLDAPWALKILETLLKDCTWPKKCDALVQLGCEQLHSGQWMTLVQNFRGTADVADRVLELRDRLEVPARREQALDKTSGDWMIVISVALGVLGLATIVNYRPTHTWAMTAVSERGSGLVFRCVLVVAALNLFDLICTTCMPTAGTLWDLTPGAFVVLESGAILTSLKAGVTVAAATILLVLRNFHFAQLVSWWTCLLYTVLIVRWSTFNSLYLP